MHTYKEAQNYLESFINYERRVRYPYKASFKLERMQEFLKELGQPQKDLNCIHIAGTKGKGSTCAFIAYILKEARYRVGLYTSPHLVTFRERIRILEQPSAGTPSCPSPEFEGMISEEEVVDFVSRLRPLADRFSQKNPYGPLSFFEIYTALAFIYFKEKKVDFAVLETGLGGRLDATNTIDALVCAITPISYEHTQKLGNTLSEIAQEKAGIIRNQKLMVISAPQEKEASEVIRNRCRQVKAQLYEVGRDIFYEKSGLGFRVWGRGYSFPELKVGLIGEHQMVNATVAIGAIQGLKNKGIEISEEAVRNGLAQTKWPGRCEVVARNPWVVLDGAQNRASALAIKEAVRKSFQYAKLFLILGVSKDKDIKGICEELYDLTDMVVLTKADNPRAVHPAILARYFKNKPRHLTQNVKDGLIKAQVLANKEDLILITGSLFVVGEARSLLKKDAP
ncbi:MAG: bifunctional folylpolyglutamate synthase/dihydrofolate synthase [Candidatus Omnitrophica bacterium]|nr:bifunctional folylpolyglutamate synthase/dihydrofolate synthase [Candidatus Omnitrophota bacterium]